MSEPKIHAAIAAIMGEIGGVAKERKNVAQGYAFRGIADVYLACQPLMAKHGVHFAPHAVLDDHLYERTTKSGGASYHVRQRIQFRFYAVDGSYIECVATGEAMDSGDKATNKAMSAAAKYALIQTFALPEEDPKIDTEGDEPPETVTRNKRGGVNAAPPVPISTPAAPVVSETLGMVLTNLANCRTQAQYDALRDVLNKKAPLPDGTFLTLNAADRTEIAAAMKKWTPVAQ